MFNLKGDVAIVTGGSKGIGKAIVYAFSVAGAKVIIADIDEENGVMVCEDLKANGYCAEMVKVNVADSKNVNEMMDYVINEYGKIDVLVNNAGILGDGEITDITDENWDRLMGINVNGVFYCCRAAVPHMIKNKKGKIINIASIAGKQGFPVAGVHYATSKGAVMAFTRQLAMQISQYGINVNAVAPVTTETDMVKNRSEEKKQYIKSKIPLGRMGKPEDTASAVLFLASSESGFITGETIDVNGGTYMD